VCVKLVRKVAPLTSDTKATDTTIQSWFGGGASCPFPDTLSTKDIPVGDCVVKVWAQRTSDLEVVLWSKTLTLDAASIGRYEREC
jgi:hypothetical protein